MPDRQCVTTLLSSKPRKILRYCDLILGTSSNWNSLKAGTPADRILIHKSAGTPSVFRHCQQIKTRIALSELSRREAGKRRDEIWRITSENTIDEIRPGAIGARPTIFLALLQHASRLFDIRRPEDD